LTTSSGTDVVSYVSIKNLIVKSITYTFSNQLSLNKDAKYYPIKGTVNISLESQDILVYSDFVKESK